MQNRVYGKKNLKVWRARIGRENNCLLTVENVLMSLTFYDNPQSLKIAKFTRK